MGPGPPDPGRLKFFRAIKYDLRNYSYRPAMTVPLFLLFTAKKLEFRPIPIFSCAAHAFRMGPDPDPLKKFWAIKYDLRNHSHRSAMTISHCFAFYGQKTRILPDSLFSCATRLPSGSGSRPNRLKFFWAIKYDLRNHRHHPAMTVPPFFAFYG